MKPHESKTVYDGNLFDVTLERWGEHEREIVEHPGAVAVVAVDAQDRVVLVRQLREPARKHLLELRRGRSATARIRRRARTASWKRKPA